MRYFLCLFFIAAFTACTPSPAKGDSRWNYSGEYAETHYPIEAEHQGKSYFSVAVKRIYLTSVTRGGGQEDTILDAFNLETLAPVAMAQKSIDGELSIDDRWKNVDKNTVSLGHPTVRYRDVGADERFYTRGYERIGEDQFGLRHEGLPVPSRPMDHWKQAFFQPGVPESDFWIACNPVTPGFSIGPIDTCIMHMVLGDGEREGRRITLNISADFHVDRLPEWRAIEAAVRDIAAQRVVFHAGSRE